MERKGRGREKSKGREGGRGREEMENRRGERRRVENLFQGFVGDRRPCLTAVNSFYVLA